MALAVNEAVIYDFTDRSRMHPEQPPAAFMKALGGRAGD